MPTVRELMNDPKFMALGPRDKIGILTLVSPEFRTLSAEERQAVAMHLSPIAAQAQQNIQRIQANAQLPEKPPPEQGWFRKGLGNMYDELAGTGKSFINAAYTPYKGVANAVQGRPADAPRNPNFEEALKPQSGAEAIGQMKGNLGMAMLPVGPAKAAEGYLALKDGPALVRAGINALTRGVIQGGTAYATAGAQGYDPTWPSATAAATGGLEPAIARGAQGLAEGLVNRNVLRSRPSTYLHGANPGRGVVNAGIGPTMEGNLPARIKGARDASGQIVDQQVAGIPGTFDPTAPLNQATDAAVQQAAYDGAPVDRLEAFRKGRLKQAGDVAAQSPMATPSTLEAPSVNAIKRDVGDSINWKSRMDDSPQLMNLRDRYYNDLNSFVRVPENANYADLAEAGKAIDAKLNRTPPSFLTNLIKRSAVAGIAGVGSGFAEHDSARGGRNAAAALLLEYMLGNTPAQLGIAQGLRGTSAASGLLPQLIGHGVASK